MTYNIIIKPSHLQNKKYDAIIDGKKTIPFGAKGMSDFTKHKDEERKKIYIDREGDNEGHKSCIYTCICIHIYMCREREG